MSKIIKNVNNVDLNVPQDFQNIINSITDRVFYLHGDIEDNNIADISYNISKLIIQDDINCDLYTNYVRQPIFLYIQSFGGSIYDALGLIDVILTSETPINTICTSYAMSAAFMIFIVGHTRFISNRATLLYHQMSCFNFGKMKDIKEDIEQMEVLQKRMDDLVLEHTNIDKKEIEYSFIHKKDLYYNAKDCIDKGIADFIIADSFTRKKDKKKRK